MALLEVVGLTKRFGGLGANDDIDLTVDEGEIVGLIGPNGAGKTTLFNCITKFDMPDVGSIMFQGEDITRLPAHQVCHRGIARTFQVTRTFRAMPVLENVLVGALCREPRPKRAREQAMEVLEFTGLLERRNAPTADLGVALQKRVEVARALATRPTLLLLDEAMAGLTPTEVADAVELVRAINRQGITVLMVEHVMEVVMPLSGRVIVLNYGEKIAEGHPSEIAQNEDVIDAYLGKRYRHA